MLRDKGDTPNAVRINQNAIKTLTVRLWCANQIWHIHQLKQFAYLCFKYCVVSYQSPLERSVMEGIRSKAEIESVIILFENSKYIEKRKQEVIGNYIVTNDSQPSRIRMYEIL